MRGVLNINKPSGISSYDVIRRLKRILGPRPPDIGHAGTLDPLASGVLLILIGEATKISRFLLNFRKEYEADILFGIETDTDDITGKVTAKSTVPVFSEQELCKLLRNFTGKNEQIPPSYSALKKNGIPFYRLARQGIDVKPKPRTVTIYQIELISWKPPHARVRTSVSSGTYIRALARDIGRVAGSAATLSGLVRTRCGQFTIDNAFKLSGITSENIIEFLIPIEDALVGMTCFNVSIQTARRLSQGQKVRTENAPKTEFGIARTKNRKFLAIVTSKQNELRPVRIIYID